MHNVPHISLMPLLSTLLLTMVLASCSDWIYDQADGCVEPKDSAEGTFVLELELQTPGGRREAPVRSGITDDIENAVNDLAVLLFDIDSQGNPVHAVSMLRPYWLEEDENWPTLYHAHFSAKVTTDVANRDLRVMALANAGDKLDMLEEQLGGDARLTYAEVQKLLVTELGEPQGDVPTPAFYPEGVQEGFVMWALPPDFVRLIPGTVATVEACLMRDLARFDVRLGDELKMSGLFDFKTVCFYRPSTRVMHVADPQRVARTYDETSHPYLYATSPTLASDNKLFWRWDYEDEVVDGVFSQKCYVPEGAVVMKGINGGTGKIKDVNHANRPAVIVGGHYNGSPDMSFYRIDICDSEGRLVDICRNHLYDITIRSVLGPGQPTPDQAYDNNNSLIIATVSDWCLVQNEVMYNGSDWITVNKRVINLTGNAGAGTTFVINSSVPVGEWEFCLGEEGDFTKGTLLQSDTFFVTRPIQEQGAKILVVTKHDLPRGNLPVAERLYVRIGGRVLFYITLVQHPLQDTYWFTGDYFPGDRGPWQGVINFPIGGKDPSVPPGAFTDFLKWLFGDSYSGNIGEGDNVSDSEFIAGFFWRFLAWFFTDEYGHVIGGTPEDWNQPWTNTIAVIVFDFFKWMLGPEYYRELSTPEWDPTHPSYSTVGALMAIKFMEWFGIIDFMREINGPDTQPYDPDNPDYTTVGAEVMSKFIAWMREQDIWRDISGWTPPGSERPGDGGLHTVDTLWDALKWYIGDTFAGMLGDEPDKPDGPDKPEDNPKVTIPGEGDNPDKDWSGDRPINGNLGDEPDSNW